MTKFEKPDRRLAEDTAINDENGSGVAHHRQVRACRHCVSTIRGTYVMMGFCRLASWRPLVTR